MLEVIENIGKRGAKCRCIRCRDTYLVKDRYSASKAKVGNLCCKCKRCVVDMGEITQSKLQTLFNYNTTTGEFIHRYDSLRNAAGDVCSSKHINGYLALCIGGKHYLLHRLIFLYMTGTMPRMVDHINHIRNDNRWCNLRDVNALENSTNMSLSTNSTSKVNGISLINATGKYRAYINKDYKQVHLGVFDTLEQAIEARNQANIKYNYHDNHGK